MAYALCFLPLIGAFIGLFLLLWLLIVRFLGLGTILSAAVASLIPLAVSGGIHMDGFLDASDALGSHASRERMLEIMKDSHIGASALIAAWVYALLSFALWTEVDASSPALIALALTPILSRALSAFAVVSFKSAKGDGLLVSFKRAADARLVRVISVLWLVSLAAVMLWRAPLYGGAILVAALVSFIVYRVLSHRRFGGTTGDVAGWFVQVCEIACLGAYVFAGKIGGLL